MVEFVLRAAMTKGLARRLAFGKLWQHPPLLERVVVPV